MCSREWVWEGWDSRVQRSYVSQEFRHQVSVQAPGLGSGTRSRFFFCVSPLSFKL